MIAGDLFLLVIEMVHSPTVYSFLGDKLTEIPRISMALMTC